MNDVNQCIICEKPSLYIVYGKGYCKQHKMVAFIRQEIINKTFDADKSEYEKIRKRSDKAWKAAICKIGGRRK